MTNAPHPRNFQTEPPPRDDMFILVAIALTVAAIPCFASLWSLIVEVTANTNAVLFMTLATKNASISVLGAALERAAGFTPADITDGMQAINESALATFLCNHWGSAVIGPSAVLGILVGRLAGRPLEKIRHVSGPQIYEGDAAKRAAAAKLRSTDFSGEGITIAGIRLNRDRETKGIQIVGKVGGGKTTVIRPIIQQAIERGDQVVIHDAKGGDFIKEFGPDKNGRNARGRYVVLLGPWDARAAKHDICEEIAAYERNPDGTWSDYGRAEMVALDVCEEIASLLCDVGKVKGNNAFFNGASAKILTGILYYHHDRYAREGTKWGWNDVSNMLKLGMKKVRTLVASAYPEICNIIEFQSDGSLSVTTKNVVATLIQTAETPIRLLARAAKDRTRPSFTVGMFARPDSKIQTLILNGNAEYEAAQTRIFGVFVELIGRKLTGPHYPERRPSEPGTWLVLDEFPQLGVQKKIQKTMEVGRSKGVRVVLGAQSPDSQYEDLYGQAGAKTIFGISQTLIFGPVSSSTAEWIAKSSGQRQVMRWTPSGYVHDRIPAIEPIDIERLKQDKHGVEVFMTFFEGFYKLKQHHIQLPARCEAFIPTTGGGGSGTATGEGGDTGAIADGEQGEPDEKPEAIPAVSSTPKVGIVDTDRKPGLVGNLAKEGGREAAKDVLSDLVGELGS